MLRWPGKLGTRTGRECVKPWCSGFVKCLPCIHTTHSLKYLCSKVLNPNCSTEASVCKGPFPQVGRWAPYQRCNLFSVLSVAKEDWSLDTIHLSSRELCSHLLLRIDVLAKFSLCLQPQSLFLFQFFFCFSGWALRLFEFACQSLIVVFETLDILALSDNRSLHLCGICTRLDLPDLLFNRNQIFGLLFMSALYGCDLLPLAGLICLIGRESRSHTDSSSFVRLLVAIWQLAFPWNIMRYNSTVCHRLHVKSKYRCC